MKRESVPDPWDKDRILSIISHNRTTMQRRVHRANMYLRLYREGTVHSLALDFRDFWHDPMTDREKDWHTRCQETEGEDAARYYVLWLMRTRYPMLYCPTVEEFVNMVPTKPLLFGDNRAILLCPI